MKIINLTTHKLCEMIEITGEIKKVLKENAVTDGVCIVFVPHTTAGITINENADSDVQRDMMNELEEIVPFHDNYLHREGNSAAHIKASLMGSSVTVLVEKGELQLGTWQGIYFCEFDGPRQRKVFVKFIKTMEE